MADLICLDPEREAYAEYLMRRFGLLSAPVEKLSESGFHLCLDRDNLSLKQGGSERTAVMVDFCAGAVAHRRKFGGGKGQDIAKAIGVTGAYRPSVVDATAGLGRDAFVLATLGCDVQAFERQPVVAALLEDGLSRAMDDIEVRPIAERISLCFGGSHQLLVSPDHGWLADIVYLDPMFDHDIKQKAAVKKDMQAFRQVVGQDTDADDLLDRALACARCRVVVKRARKATPMAGRKPSYSLIGKSNRFDVYALAKVAPLEN